MPDPISSAQAETLIREHTPDFPAETVSLDEAHGGILREPVAADRDAPPFDRATMDGVALASAALAGGRTSFRIEAVAAAGHPSPPLQDPGGGCVHIMTGAEVPAGADQVVPIEELSLRDQTAVVTGSAPPASGANIHPKGSDGREGDVWLTPGTRLDAPRLAMAAAAGRATLSIGRRPSITVVSTGDELVEPGYPIAPYQIRPSNAYAIRADLVERGFGRVDRVHIRDKESELTDTLERLLSDYGVLILSGGVSMGKFDLVPKALADLGVRKVFHKVRQRPGKPMWFGVSGEGRPVFALPGNPASALTCFRRYVVPQLYRSLGESDSHPETAVLAEPAEVFKPLTVFLSARFENAPDGRLLAHPIPPNTSGDFLSVGRSGGFVECVENRDRFEAGEVVRCWKW